MAALDSSPPPDNTALRALPGPPRIGGPLSVPPTASALAGDSAPYSLTQGQSLFGAPLLFARSFVALFERPNGALAAHSIVLSELSRLVAVELGWSQDAQEQVELAALLHDLGKSKSRHLTPFSVWNYVEYEQVARQQFLLPLQVFAASGLPPPVVQALTHLYERVDGRGFPSGLSADAVPPLSQVVGLCDSYLDLTLHAHNPFGRALAPREALTALKEKAGSLFEPTLVETLTQLVLVEGIDVRARQRQVTL
jgi:response regulator RpfG family c-di-GMP phosphodiesterase